RSSWAMAMRRDALMVCEAGRDPAAQRRPRPFFLAGFFAGLALDFLAGFFLEEAFFLPPFMGLAMVLPSPGGEWVVFTPAFSRALNLAWAVPAPPETMAPAWPMRLPGGAVTPAM